MFGNATTLFIFTKRFSIHARVFILRGNGNELFQVQRGNISINEDVFLLYNEEEYINDHIVSEGHFDILLPVNESLLDSKLNKKINTNYKLNYIKNTISLSFKSNSVPSIILSEIDRIYNPQSFPFSCTGS